ncbi:MAG: hypothetical protein FWE67_00580 [Planctomycetaceae bacterium]|nr:hypothetical protein [Planctomycetaceae bacterium]
MTAEASSPPVISFKECRDEEIAGFFANGGKKFNPILPSCKEEALLRVVGSPHFPVKGRKSERKASARFASAGTAPSIQLCRSTLADSIEESRHSVSSRPTLALGTLLTSGNSVRQHSRAAKVVCDPLEDKPVMCLSQAQKAISALTGSNVNEVPLLRHKPERKAAGNTKNADTSASPELPQQSSVQESLLERLEVADAQLQMLVGSWSKIPDRLKETIRALVEVSSKETE